MIEERLDKLVGTTLKLRSTLSIALLALADIENCESLDEARAKARDARLRARSVLAPHAAEPVVVRIDETQGGQPDPTPLGRPGQPVLVHSQP